jgi:hypothetical protein
VQTLEEELRRATAAREMELRKPLWERQLTLGVDASTTAATIATTDDDRERKKAQDHFWQLYYGPLVIVESKEISAAMQEFGKCLRPEGNYTDEEMSTMKSLSLALASAVQRSLRDWDIPLSDFSKDKWIYKNKRP